MPFVSKSAKKIEKNREKFQSYYTGKRAVQSKATLWINIGDVIMMWITINLDHISLRYVSKICGAVRKNY